LDKSQVKRYEVYNQVLWIYMKNGKTIRVTDYVRGNEDFQEPDSTQLEDYAMGHGYDYSEDTDDRDSDTDDDEIFENTWD
jgi:hypothetical protein